MLRISISEIRLKITLSLLFQSQERRYIAYSLLSEIKVRQRRGDGYKASERVKFCKEKGFDLLTYDQVLHILRKNGLIRKDGNRLLLSFDFLDSINDEWRKFLFE